MTVTSTTIVSLTAPCGSEMRVTTSGDKIVFNDYTMTWPIEHAQALIDAIQQVCGIDRVPHGSYNNFKFTPDISSHDH